jgi:hypothetical protein
VIPAEVLGAFQTLTVKVIAIDLKLIGLFADGLVTAISVVDAGGLIALMTFELGVKSVDLGLEGVGGGHKKNSTILEHIHATC